MESELISLSIVQFDMVNSTEIIKNIHGHLGNKGLRMFVSNIEIVVSKAFDELVKTLSIDSRYSKIIDSEIKNVIDDEIPNSDLSKKPNLNRIIDAMADGYRLTFESLELAYEFITVFCIFVEDYNKTKNDDEFKWSFRIGLTEDTIDCNSDSLNQMVGNGFAIVKELEAGAFPGWLFVDDVTYNKLSQDIKNNFSKQNFKNKKGQPREANGCLMFTSSNMNSSSKPQTIILTDEKKQQLINILKTVFSENELETICMNNTTKLEGNPYNAIPGNTVNDRYSYLVNYLIRKELMHNFLDLLCKESKYFASLVQPLRG
ncbi:hypothetical protein H6G91_32030 [Nostoc muscorum FACHB-395]|nr:hypothetical protein [Desmonostoc muscorum FACHB-395]